jgi:hypothetical protein
MKEVIENRNLAAKPPKLAGEWEELKKLPAEFQTKVSFGVIDFEFNCRQKKKKSLTGPSVFTLRFKRLL